jgi:thiol-disulfide isomerase/thioredoxin
MNRRPWLLWGAGVAALAAGGAWRAFGTKPGSGDAQAATSAGSPPPDPAADLWSLNFPKPDGRTLSMAELRGKPLVLNFWATWCAPCIKEMPDLDRFAKGFAKQGGQVVGLAVDNPKSVREFLARAPVSYAIGLAGFEGTDLSRRLGNTSGALPFTVVFDRNGRIAQRRLGETRSEELQAWARSL